MALKIEYLKIEDVTCYGKNARMHSPEQIEQLVNSIQEFGFTNPILIDDDGNLIAGHGRLEAAEKLGLDDVPAIRLRNLSEKQVKALRIADNQLALNASWDMDLLAAELAELDSDSFDLDLLGFDDEFLAGLLPDEPDVIPGSPPDQQQEQSEATEKVDVLIGPYKFSVKQSDWKKWETAVRSKVGMDSDMVLAELKKRLGLKG